MTGVSEADKATFLVTQSSQVVSLFASNLFVSGVTGYLALRPRVLARFARTPAEYSQDFNALQLLPSE
jgi:hypothetical protein